MGVSSFIETKGDWKITFIQSSRNTKIDSSQYYTYKNRRGFLIAACCTRSFSMDRI